MNLRSNKKIQEVEMALRKVIPVIAEQGLSICAEGLTDHEIECLEFLSKEGIIHKNKTTKREIGKNMKNSQTKKRIQINESF